MPKDYLSRGDVVRVPSASNTFGGEFGVFEETVTHGETEVMVFSRIREKEADPHVFFWVDPRRTRAISEMPPVDLVGALQSIGWRYGNADDFLADIGAT